jgi:hypothetical protein
MTAADEYNPYAVGKAGAFERIHSANPSAGKAAVAAMIAEAEKEDDDREALHRIGLGDPKPNQTLDGIKPGEWEADEDGLPPGCPVLPLGTDDGAFIFLDTIGQMRVLAAGEMNQAGINALFMGRHLWLYWAFPKKDKDGAVASWRPEKVREVLMAACAKKGAWNAMEKVRGRGFWKGRDGRLLLHAGDRIISSHDIKAKEGLGEFEGMVYPTRPPLPRPWPKTLRAQAGPALKLFPHFKTWNWSRPQLDPVLLMGWIGVAYMGGALRWRPEIFMLGDKARGKSALQEDLKSLMGSFLVQSTDATAAGIYQDLKFDCLPLSLDEFEATEDNRKQKAVIELARRSASGGKIMRGGDKGTGSQFYGRSAFIFSMINAPAMDPQDLSRMAMLRLRELDSEAVRPIIEEDEMMRLGRQIMRRLMDNWHRWPATLAAWRQFLASCGHTGRGQDTFGTLLAAADMIIDHDAEALGLDMAAAAVDFEGWRGVLEAAQMAEFEDSTDNWRLCLTHLMAQRVDAWRGGSRHTVSEVLIDFMATLAGRPTEDDGFGFARARKLLEQTGLSILQPNADNPEYELFVPNQNPLVHALFKGTKWAGEMSAGVWGGSLKDAPLDTRRDASGRIAGDKAKGSAFRLGKIIVKRKDAEA